MYVYLCIVDFLHTTVKQYTIKYSTKLEIHTNKTNRELFEWRTKKNAVIMCLIKYISESEKERRRNKLSNLHAATNDLFRINVICRWQTKKL
jgi:hypothetical protein